LGPLERANLNHLAGQSKKMAAEELSFKQCKIILKLYWKFENLCEVQSEGWHNFATEPPTRLKTADIRDKFETNGTAVQIILHYLNNNRSTAIFSDCPAI
jgi:hypothetical protein